MPVLYSCVEKENPSRDGSASYLVDGPIVDGYISVESNHEKRTTSGRHFITVKRFLSSYEDFLEPRSMILDEESPFNGLSRDRWLTDLVDYWERQPPFSFDRKNPTPFALSPYPLKVISAEWVNCVAAMLNTDLQNLQRRRRSLASQRKVVAVKRFVLFRQKQAINNLESEDCATLLGDFDYLANTLNDYSLRLENMLPVVTSLVQISDSCPSLVESANVSRLTSLAFIFVRLTFTTSLFSMNTTNGPSGDYFWVFFVVAIPITLLVFLTARPPPRIIHSLYVRVRPVKYTHSSV